MGTAFEEAERQCSGLVDKYKAPSSAWFEATEADLGPDGRKFILQILQGHVDTRGQGDVGPTLRTAGYRPDPSPLDEEDCHHAVW